MVEMQPVSSIDRLRRLAPNKEEVRDIIAAGAVTVVLSTLVWTLTKDYRVTAGLAMVELFGIKAYLRNQKPSEGDKILIKEFKQKS